MSEPVGSFKKSSSIDDLYKLMKGVDENSIKVGRFGVKRVKIGQELIKKSEIIKKFNDISKKEGADPKIVRKVSKKIDWITKELEGKQGSVISKLVRKLFGSSSDKNAGYSSPTDSSPSPPQSKKEESDAGSSTEVSTLRSRGLEKSDAGSSEESSSGSETVILSPDNGSKDQVPKDSLSSSSDSDSEDSTDIPAPDDSFGSFSDEEDFSDDESGSLEEVKEQTPANYRNSVVIKNNKSDLPEIKQTYELVETMLSLWKDPSFPKDTVDHLLNTDESTEKEKESVKNRNEGLYQSLIKDKKIPEPLTKHNENMLHWLCMISETRDLFPETQKQEANELYRLVEDKLKLHS
jgi:hypothetical protein